MFMMTRLPGVECHCGEEGISYGTKEEPSIWKVYADCSECGREVKVGRVRQSDIDHIDEVGEKAEELVRQHFGG